MVIKGGTVSEPKVISTPMQSVLEYWWGKSYTPDVTHVGNNDRDPRSGVEQPKRIRKCLEFSGHTSTRRTMEEKGEEVTDETRRRVRRKLRRKLERVQPYLIRFTK